MREESDGLIEIVESLSLRSARSGNGPLARQLEATASAHRLQLNVPRDPALQREIDDALGGDNGAEPSLWTLDEALERGLADARRCKS